MSIKALLFDLDGTLIDQFEAIHRAFSRVLVEMGFDKPSFAEVKRAVGGAADATMTKLIGTERAQEALQRLRPIFEEEMFNGLIALPGAFEVLQSARKRSLNAGVLTNKHGPHARAVCDFLGFSEFLSFTIGANDTEWKKPNPKLSHYALEKLGTQPPETVYVGDSPYDYETACNSGMKSALIATGTHSKTELGELDDCLVFDDLPDFLENYPW